MSFFIQFHCLICWLRLRVLPRVGSEYNSKLETEAALFPARTRETVSAEKPGSLGSYTFVHRIRFSVSVSRIFNRRLPLGKLFTRIITPRRFSINEHTLRLRRIIATFPDYRFTECQSRRGDKNRNFWSILLINVYIYIFIYLYAFLMCPGFAGEVGR